MLRGELIESVLVYFIVFVRSHVCRLLSDFSMSSDAGSSASAMSSTSRMTGTFEVGAIFV